MKKLRESRGKELYVFFQTIKVGQNYFAILAKVMILSLSIVDFNNKNKSLASVIEVTFGITANCNHWSIFWVLNITT
tara:strand:+ start:281 stop:511 length:231 start_codon:yes stop_codon:yes gene_type:complete